MNTKERAEHSRLLNLWATGRATRKQILRCRELDHQAQSSALAANYAIGIANDANERAEQMLKADQQ